VVGNLRNGTNAGDHLQNRRYVPIDCIGKKTLTLSQCEPWENAQSSLILFEKGDILFGAMRPYFHKVAVAPWAGVTRTTCLVLKPRDVAWTGYAAYLLFQEETVAYATAHSTGATIPYTAWEDTMSEMGVVVPPGDVARAFGEIAEPMLLLAGDLAAKNAALRQTRDLLLSKLISGEVDVSELDIRIPENAA
jgi:type I restriction enzyme S subunit